MMTPNDYFDLPPEIKDEFDRWMVSEGLDKAMIIDILSITDDQHIRVRRYKSIDGKPVFPTATENTVLGVSTIPDVVRAHVG